MLISPALAWNSIPGSGTSGGAATLSIIIAVAITVLLIHVARKKWRKRRLARHGGKEE